MEAVIDVKAFRRTGPALQAPAADHSGPSQQHDEWLAKALQESIIGKQVVHEFVTNPRNRGSSLMTVRFEGGLDNNEAQEAVKELKAFQKQLKEVCVDNSNLVSLKNELKAERIRRSTDYLNSIAQNDIAAKRSIEKNDAINQIKLALLEQTSLLGNFFRDADDGFRQGRLDAYIKNFPRTKVIGAIPSMDREAAVDYYLIKPFTIEFVAASYHDNPQHQQEALNNLNQRLKTCCDAMEENLSQYKDGKSVRPYARGEAHEPIKYFNSALFVR
jgi:hypothetical protein